MIMAGGTGGHLFPALAVADAMRREGWRIVWLGAKSGMEATLVPKEGYEMVCISFAGVRGKGLVTQLALPLNLLVAFWQSARALFLHRPHVVLGMGGYVAFPGGMMASLFNRPLVIHEQNAIAGLANRVLAGVADRVLVAFPGALPKSTFVGNPVRESIGALPPPRERYASRNGPLRILVVGGSLGAAALNELVPRALALLPPAERPLATHQSGAKNIEALRENYARAGVSATVVAFIDDMAQAYAEADLVICRAGATTIAELAAAGVASVLVPFPFAVDDHQSANARYLADASAAILMQQRDLDPAALAELLRGLDRPRLAVMAAAARGQSRPGATAAVAAACTELAR